MRTRMNMRNQTAFTKLPQTFSWIQMNLEGIPFCKDYSLSTAFNSSEVTVLHFHLYFMFL